MKICISLILLALSALARAETRPNNGGNLVGNGAGLAEAELVYAYQRLPETIDRCLELKACGISPAEKSLLERVRAILRDFPDPADKIHVLSERELPGFFSTGANEQHRIAKTDSRTRSIIFVNRDALYDAAGRSAIDLPRAASVLTHELGHQAGEESHLALDVLGGKLRAQLERGRVTILFPESDLQMSVFSGAAPADAPGLYLRNSDSSLDLGHELLLQLPCPGGIPAVGAQFVNPHWESGYSYLFSAYVRYVCLTPEGYLETRKADARIWVRADTALPGSVLKRKDITFEIERR